MKGKIKEKRDLTGKIQVKRSIIIKIRKRKIVKTNKNQ
jgi:hypothetical protein